MKKKRFKPLLVSALCSFVAVPLVFEPLLVSAIYEAIFASTTTNEAWMELSYEDYGLQMVRSDFKNSDNTTLAGYKYSRANQDVKGVVVVAHGLGCGGHNMFIPYINFFTSNGYLVFSYDVTGNGNSGSKTVEGLPQGVIDLDYALRHVKTLDEYKDLPIFLFGHSWGAYSCGAVLNLHKDISGAVIVSGFNKSDNLLLHQAESRVGVFAKAGIPSVSFYENVKFGGEYANLTSIDGFNSSNARVLIVHSRDDESVPTKYGYDLFHKKLSSSNRFEFLLYDDKGHTDILYSNDALKYMDTLEDGYEKYLEQNGKQDSQDERNSYMNANANKIACFEPNPDITSGALRVFEGK